MSNKYEQIKYSIGEKIRYKISGEGAVIEKYNDMPFCHIVLRSLRNNEIDAVNSGNVIVELRYVEDVVFMFLKIGNCLKYEIPFNLGEYTKFQSSSYERENCIMPIVLVDAETGIIRAMRVIELNKDLTERICELALSDGHKTVSYHQRLKNVFKRSSFEKLNKYTIARQSDMF